MPDSPYPGNDLHQHPDLPLAPQLQNLSYDFFVTLQNQVLSTMKEFSPRLSKEANPV
jgi:hypothetical protein